MIELQPALVDKEEELCIEVASQVELAKLIVIDFVQGLGGVRLELEQVARFSLVLVSVGTGLRCEPEVVFAQIALVLVAIEWQIVLELKLILLEGQSELDVVIVLVAALHFLLGRQIGEHERLSMRLLCRVGVLIQLQLSLVVAGGQTRNCMEMVCNELFLRRCLVLERWAHADVYCCVS